MGKKRDLTSEDKALWENFTKNIKALHSESNQPPAISKGEKVKKLSQISLGLPKDNLALPQKNDSFGEIDHRTQQKLARGQFPIEGRLDLHGLTQVEAHNALIDFIIRSSQQSKRCLLIITGKGGVQPDHKGILRQMVPRWLLEPNLRQLILSITSAQPKDGGTGALYILLKRHRH